MLNIEKSCNLIYQYSLCILGKRIIDEVIEVNKNEK